MPNQNRQVALLTVAHRVKPSGRLWNPAADVYRSEDGWMVKVDLAGICADELEIGPGRFTACGFEVAGETRSTGKDSLISRWRSLTADLKRRFNFPARSTAESLAHDYRDGFLNR